AVRDPPADVPHDRRRPRRRLVRGQPLRRVPRQLRGGVPVRGPRVVPPLAPRGGRRLPRGLRAGVPRRAVRRAVGAAGAVRAGDRVREPVLRLAGHAGPRVRAGAARVRRAVLPELGGRVGRAARVPAEHPGDPVLPQTRVRVRQGGRRRQLHDPRGPAVEDDQADRGRVDDVDGGV
ncbi:MAG: hypothetical protein AVDCRST_MAG64-4377, partial [uncultured Phycisphaerae bacterium]